MTIFLSLGAVAAESNTDQGSYQVGYGLAQQAVGRFTALDHESFLAGVKDQLAGKDSRVPANEVNAAIQALMNESQALAAVAAEKMAQAGETFLAENAKRDGVVTLPSGLQYEVITKGTGAKPTASSEVTTHYAGRLMDGTEFDSSYKRGQPARFAVNAVIAGWTEALQLMQEGSKWRLYIPPSLGYGARGAPPSIPGNATLIFEVELIKVES